MSVLITKQEASALYAAVFNRAPDAEGLAYWTGTSENNFEQMATSFTQHPVFADTYDEMSNEDFVAAIYKNVLLGEGDAEGIAFWADALDGGMARGDFIAEFIGASLNYESNPEFEGDEAALLRKQALVNRADVGIEFAETMGKFSNIDPENLPIENQQAYKDSVAAIAGVNASGESVEAARAIIQAQRAAAEKAEGDALGEEFHLTDGRDNLVGTDGNDTFIGDVGQNQNGAISNAFATGDILDGGAGRDKIVASIMNDEQVDGGGFNHSSIRASTKNIEEAYFEALKSEGSGVNLGGDKFSTVTVNAGRMDSVDQFWSNNSSADLILSDVRLGSKLGITKDITFGLRDVDTGVGLAAAFDSASLTNAGNLTTNSSMVIRAADVSTETPETPLKNVQMQVDFDLGGERVAINVRSEDGTYAGLRTAIEEALTAEVHGDLEVTLGATYNTVQFAGNDTRLPFTAQEILITDPAGQEFSSVQFTASNIEPVDGGFLLAGNAAPVDPTTSSTYIESNLILDNAGRESTAGDVVIGGLSNSQKYVEKLNLQVDRSSKIDDLLTATNMKNTGSMNNGNFEGNTKAFEVIQVTSGAANGDLVINNVGNVENFDATAFQGENLSVAGVAVDQTSYVYNTSSSNDTINVTYGVEAAASSDFSLSINTGGGNDQVIVGAFGGTESAVINHFSQNNVRVNTGAGEDKVYVGDNNSRVNVDTGAGADFIQVSNAFGVGAATGNTAQWIFNAEQDGSPSGPMGQGNQSFQVFKAKLQVEFQGLTSEIVAVNYDNFITTSNDINAAIKAAIENDPQLSQLLGVTNTVNAGLQIDSLIHRALDQGALKVNFIAPTYQPNDSNNQSSGFQQDSATLFAERASITEQEMKDAWEAYYPDSEGIGQGSGTGIYASANNTSTMYDALFNAVDYSVTTPGSNLGGYNQEQTWVGADSTELTQNVINAGAGDDMIVLSTNWTTASGYDVVKFEGNFGNDTVMNFNTGTAAGAGIADQMDFTSYLDAVAAGRGASTVADLRVDQKVDFTFVNGLNTALSNSINHNAVVMVGLDKVFADFNANATNNPKTFESITTAMVERALTENPSWVNSTGAAGKDMIGSSFVLRLAADKQIETNATGDAILGDSIDAQKEIVYTVKITGWNADDQEYTFSAAQRGTIEYGDMFSTLADVKADAVTGTEDASLAAANAINALKGLEPEVPTEAPTDEPTDAPTDEPTDAPDEEFNTVEAENNVPEQTLTGVDGEKDVFVFHVDADNQGAFSTFGEAVIENYNKDDGDIILFVDSKNKWSSLDDYLGGTISTGEPATLVFNTYNPLYDQSITIEGVEKSGWGNKISSLEDSVNFAVTELETVGTNLENLDAYINSLAV